MEQCDGLRNMDGLLPEVMNHSSDAMIMLTVHEGTYRFIYANPAARKLGFPEEQLGKTIEEAYPPDTELYWSELFGKVLRNQEPEVITDPSIALHGTLDGMYTVIPSEVKQGQDPYLLIIVKDKASESEERYRKLFELIPDPVLIYQNGEILRANQALLNQVGAAAADEIVGKNVYQLVHPDDWQLAQDRIHRMEAKGEQLKPTELKLIRLDGSTLTAGVHATAITFNGVNCILSIWRDITERKKVEELLRKKRKKYELIATNMKDLVAVFDSNAIMTYASPSHEAMLGISPVSLEGKSLLQIVHPDDVPIVMDKFHQLRSDRVETNVEFRFLHANGDDIMVEATGSIIENENGELENILIVSRDIRERKQLEDRLKELAYYDPLTALPNRRHFEELFDRALSYADRYKQFFALLYLDLDGFKAINDTLGHAAGDELLRKFALIVDDSLRSSDLFARLGGDEFAILLPECKGEEGIQVASKIIDIVREHCSYEEEHIVVGTSIGISIYPDHGTSMEVLLKRADEALYGAKEAGKNQCMLAIAVT